LAVAALAPAVLLVVIIAFLLKGSENISRLNFAFGVGLGGTALVFVRALFPRHALRVTRGRLVNELVIVDGKSLADWVNAPVVMDAERIGIRPDLDDPVMLDRFGHLTAAFDRIVIDSVSERHRNWALLLKGANVDGEIVMEEYNQFGAIGVGNCDGRASMLVARKPLSMHDRMRKRMLDLAITVPLIILISPLLLLTALAVKLDSRGPILFKQLRIGRGNRLFQVLKFRSMRAERADPRGDKSTERNDDRVTRVGRFIRATSIDELPQLFNVLLGDMSLVGPRPHTLGSLAGGRLFWHIDVTYWHRHQLKPGITGLAQVRGFRGATLELSDLTNRLQADMEYIQGWDIWRDITILVNTFRVRKGGQPIKRRCGEQPRGKCSQEL
jgi:lipopolysaccharide/colanic/teichoic acid biosynthesis glycosyltransferase